MPQRAIAQRFSALAHRDKSRSPEFTVGIDAKADICGQAVSAEPVANDPQQTRDLDPTAGLSASHTHGTIDQNPNGLIGRR